ncbi:MAG: AAA family ATPase, partial [Cyanobacteria bacterium J06642_3]
MARSLRVSTEYIAQVKQAVKRNSFPSQKALAIELGLSLSTIKSFLNGRPVDYLNFVEIAEKLDQDWQEISQINETTPQVTIPDNFFAYDYSWVGRDKLITDLSQSLHNSRRFLLILGLTGIGKTALAERLAIELQDLIQGDWDNKLLRANFDYDEKSTDFASVAGRWLESLGENIPAGEKKPELLLNRLVRRLQDNRYLVLIDSMERLLTENEDGSWGDFSDQYWEQFFLRLLSAESCQSKLIATSQDLPV